MEYAPLTDYIHREFNWYISHVVWEMDSNIEEDIEAVGDIIVRLCPDHLEQALSVLEKENVMWDQIEKCCEAEVEDDLGYKQSVWGYLLDHERIRCSWENVEAYYIKYGDDKAWISYIDKNIDVLILLAEDEVVSDEVREKLLFEDFSEGTYRKIIKGIYKGVYNDTLSKIDSMKIRILIEEKTLPFTKAYWDELSTISPDLRVLYAMENKLEFIQNLDDITLTIDEVNKMLEIDSFDDRDKDLILRKIIPSEMTDVTVGIIRNVNRTIPKEYVEKAWEILADEEKYQLLLNHMDVYQNDELPALFRQLSPEYQQFVERIRHKYSIGYSGCNKALLEKLKERDYITSVEEEYVEKTDRVLFISKREHVLTGYVKQAK